MSGPLLEVKNLTKHFGGLAANTDISLAVAPGELVGVIGPNGAGKSTLFNCIAGLHAPTLGQVFFAGQETTGLPPHAMARLGLARTFQVYAAGGDLSAVEFVMVGAFLRDASRRRAEAAARSMLERFGLERHAAARVRDLPVAAQKLLTMATALATRPRMLLLDEVAAGLNPSEIEEMIASIASIHQDMGITVLLIEHILALVMRLSQRVLVLDYGQLIVDGPPAEVAAHPDVVRAYLGERYAARLAGGDHAPA